MHRNKCLPLGSALLLLAMAELTVASSAAKANSLVIARFNMDGSLDMNFGSQGTILGTDVGQGLRDVAIDLVTAKIVVVGHDGHGSILVERYTFNGGLDTSFSGDGKVLINHSTLSNEIGVAVAIEASTSKVVVLGASQEGFLSVTRLLSNGNFDTSFGEGGSRISGSPGDDCSVPNGIRPTDVAIDPNGGRVLVAGQLNDTHCAGVEKFLVARLTSSGSLDASFNGDGFAVARFNTSSRQGAQAIAIGPDLKIVAAGWVFNGGTTSFGLMRFTTSGSLDTTFDGDGRDIINFTSCTGESAFGVAVNASNQIISGGTAICDDGIDHFAAARSNASGGLDTSFEQDGKLLLTTRDGVFANSLAMSGNKTILFGTAYDTVNDVQTRRFMIARFNADGTRDNTFDSDGFRTLVFQGLNADGYGVATDGSRIVGVGEFTE